MQTCDILWVGEGKDMGDYLEGVGGWVRLQVSTHTLQR
jgi:hypothetical protein